MVSQKSIRRPLFSRNHLYHSPRMKWTTWSLLAHQGKPCLTLPIKKNRSILYKLKLENKSTRFIKMSVILP